MVIERIHEESNNIEYIRNQLYAYNKQCMDAPFEAINLIVRGEDKAVQGGLLGHRFGDSIFIEILWVSEQQRNHGYGSRLLAELELIAEGCGARMIHLDTFNFQAPDFYIKHGYEVFGILHDTPLEGNSRYFLKKDLAKK